VIEVMTVKKKFGKVYTTIKGIDTKEIDLEELAKKLKTKFACGGTAKQGVIELQGNHTGKVRQALVDLGFALETIAVKKDEKRAQRSR
jgi:translation initiation factor 1